MSATAPSGKLLHYNQFELIRRGSDTHIQKHHLQFILSANTPPKIGAEQALTPWIPRT